MKRRSHGWGSPGSLGAIRLVAVALCVAGVLTAVPAVAPALGLTAREIMQRVNDRDDGDNQTADIEMRLIDSAGNERLRRLRQYRKDVGKDTYSLMFFLSPADVKDTGFLTYDYDSAGKDDDQWLYLPALRRSKRIASGDKSSSFMGTDFNYSDMTRPDLDEYTFTLLREEPVPGGTAWVIEAVPKSPATVESTGYAKTHLWVRQDNDVVVRALRWVHKSSQTKTMQVRVLERIDKIWVATDMEMSTRQGDKVLHSTVLRQVNTRFNLSLPADLFTLRRMEKGP
jgi:hypothetical protein